MKLQKLALAAAVSLACLPLQSAFATSTIQSNAINYCNSINGTLVAGVTSCGNSACHSSGSPSKNDLTALGTQAQSGNYSGLCVAPPAPAPAPSTPTPPAPAPAPSTGGMGTGTGTSTGTGSGAPTGSTGGSRGGKFGSRFGSSGRTSSSFGSRSRSSGEMDDDDGSEGSDD